MSLGLLNHVQRHDAYKTLWKDDNPPNTIHFSSFSFSYAFSLDFLWVVCNILHSHYMMTAYDPFEPKKWLMGMFSLKKQQHITFLNCPTCNKVQLNAPRWNLFSEDQVRDFFNFYSGYGIIYVNLWFQI